MLMVRVLCGSVACFGSVDSDSPSERHDTSPSMTHGDLMDGDASTLGDAFAMDVTSPVSDAGVPSGDREPIPIVTSGIQILGTTRLGSRRAG